MNITERVKPWIGRKSVRGLIVLAVIVLAILLVRTNKADESVTAAPVSQPVTLLTPMEYAGGQSLSLIGTVRAFTEAKITSESAGRVVAVNVTLGQPVQAGQLLGSLENASERAAVLQAEGVYDAAVAAAAQNNIGQDEAQNTLKIAQNSAVSTFKSAYNTTNGIIRNSVDTFFSDPKAKVPGLRIDGKGLTTTLNQERAAYEIILSEWQTKANTISVNADLPTELTYANEVTQRTINLIDTFLTLFSQQDNGGRYSEAELQTFTANFTNLRATLIGVQSAIDGSLSNLEAARDTIKRAELAASGGTVSSADAQVKQALGALRAAQANLNKTIFRSPISGTVNALTIRVGDFINSFAPVALVANNQALEIVTYISDNERNLLTEGDTVIIEGEFEGVVTEIAPAVDTETRKTEVRIATEGTGIVNGDTVRITREVSDEQLKTNTIMVPLSAVKFEQENGFMFTVVDNKLVSKPVTLGTIRGGSVEILDGLASDEPFVKDARGLLAGTDVQITE